MQDIGIISKNAGLAKGKEVLANIAGVYESEFLTLLDRYCDPDVVLEEPKHAQLVVGMVTPAHFRKRGVEAPEWLVNRPMFRALEPTDEGGSDRMDLSADGTSTARDRDLANEFVRAGSGQEAVAVIADGLVQKMARILSLTPEEVDRNKPLHVYGVDSLLAVELRSWFRGTFKADIATFDITGQAALQVVAENVARESKLRGGPKKS